ncbi:MAG: DUF1460 domain-containing protein [bacterium]|nr:DUF1460 domain-containing protein [bacterium]
MNRRNFLALIAAAPFAVQLQAQSLRRTRKKNTDTVATTKYIFAQAMRRAAKNNWHRKPIGELMGDLAFLLQGTPYVGGTLEGEPEMCRIDLTGLDCVTLFESVLGMARIVKRKEYTFDALINEITLTRYRQGILDGYPSRLHYTSDWIDDNVAKGVVQDITRDLGGVIFPIKINFMSTHPQYYKPLKEDTAARAKIAEIESEVNARMRYYIPKDRIETIESMLATGDIIAISTSKDGLDYSHTGLIFRDIDGNARFLHASSQKKKVVLDVRVGEYVNSVKSNTGITVVRPLEPIS